MYDGSIRIDTKIEDNNVTRELRKLQRELSAMQHEMELANLKAMLPFKKQMIETEKEMFQLAKTMGNYSGTTQEFMGEVNALGKAFKKTQDEMINADRSIAQSMIQTAGQMANMSTQASKVRENYERMGNPMYTVNKLGLGIADTMNKIANNGNEANLALRMLGPNASMKQLYDMQNLITQGVMRFEMVSLAAAATATMFYGSLHKAAMEANEGYKQSFEGMIAALRKAIDPLITVFADVMTYVYKGVTAIADWVSAFNESHPVIAKVVAGVVLLVPALMLLLSPLAVGVGLIAGMQAAFASVWALIGPLVTGLAAMSGTVWLVAGAIVGVVSAIMYFWNTNEAFRNAVISAWQAIQNIAQTVFGLIGVVLTNLIAKFNEVKQAFINAFSTGDWSQITGYFAQLIPTIIAVLVGGIPGLLITAARFIPAISEGMLSNSAILAETITSIFSVITSFIATNLPILIEQGVTIIQNIVNGLVTALPVLVEGFTVIITQVVMIITTLLPTILECGIQILQAIVDGVLTLLPVLLETALMLITSFIQILSENMPVILEAGIQILMTLIEGITQTLPQFIECAIQLIQTIVQTVTELLPEILNTGIEILLALIDGIVQILPQLIDTIITLVNTVVELIIENLPLIVESGVEILLALIDGIVNMLPQLIECAINLVLKIVDTLIKNLPEIIEAGVKLLLALIEGIFKIIPQLITSVIKLVSTIVETVIKNLPKIISAGGELLKALIKGIVQLATSLGSAIKNDIIPQITQTLKSLDLSQIGKDIINGLISGIKSMASSVLEAIASLIPSKIRNAASGLMSTLGLKGYAKGGIITKPEIAWIGEGGDTEAVIPWNNSQRSKDLWYRTGQALGMFDDGTLANTTKSINAAASKLTGTVSYPTAVTASTGGTNGNSGNVTVTSDTSIADVILDGEKVGRVVAKTVSKVQYNRATLNAAMKGMNL